MRISQRTLLFFFPPSARGRIIFHVRISLCFIDVIVFQVCFVFLTFVLYVLSKFNVVRKTGFLSVFSDPPLFFVGFRNIDL